MNHTSETTFESQTNSEMALIPAIESFPVVQHEQARSTTVRKTIAAPLVSKKKLAFFLFVTTFLSLFFVGMNPGFGLSLIATENGLVFPTQFSASFIENGLKFSISLMLILFAHEMGHYLQAIRYQIPSTVPYFIPFPISPFGTMGAVIFQDSHQADRKVLFDIAISGPLAGLVFAIPIAYFGVLQGSVIETSQISAETLPFQYGNPLLISWMIELVHGPLQPGQTFSLNPYFFAAWIGILISALNLMPIGQLDGGHILYSLIGKRAIKVTFFILGLAIAYMIYSQYFAYSLMILILLVMNPRHPATANDQIPLGTPRIILGWAMLAFILIGFTPRPIIF